MKLPCNPRTFGLVGLDELLIHFGKGFFGLFDVSDVLGENKNSSPPPEHNFDSLPEIHSERPAWDERMSRQFASTRQVAPSNIGH